MAFFVAALAFAMPARAQRAIDVETFRPTIDGFGLLTVERAETARQFDFGFHLYIDYAHEPLRLAMKDPAASATAAATGLTTLMPWQVVAHLGAHVGLTDWLELALDIPASEQRYAAAYGDPTVDPPKPGAATRATGFYAAEPRTTIGPPDASPLDPRIALKARTPRLGPTGLALILAATVPFGDGSAFLGAGDFTFRPTAIFDVAVGRFTLALNGGAIVRRQQTVLDPVDVLAGSAAPSHLISVGTEVTAGLGIGVRAASFVTLVAESAALIPVTSEGGPGAAAPRDYVLDVLGAARFFPTSNLALTVGGGAGVLDGRRHDAFRAFIGLSFTPSGSGGAGRAAAKGGDRDGDGVPDSNDLCPTEPEDKDGFEDEDGCPDPDNDGDGLRDGVDRCPNELEDKDGFEDDDGCPDLDNDRDGVPDVVDACPDEAEDRDGYDDADGCPDPDNDADGIPDVRDRCPNEPETRNGIDDEDGCPDSGGLAAPSPVPARPTPIPAPSRRSSGAKKSGKRAVHRGGE